MLKKPDNKQEAIALLEIIVDMLKGDHELPKPKVRVEIEPKVLEVVKYNQLPDQSGKAHPNKHIFEPIEAELNRLCKLANGIPPHPPTAGLPPKDETAKAGPEMKKVQSTNVDSFGYTHTTKILRVKFINGGVYDYHDVPPEIAEGLEKAQSPGGFIAAHVKGSFKYTQL